MTNATAMTLVLLMFVTLFLAAVVIILFGGRYFERPRRPVTRMPDIGHHRRAA